MNAPKEKMGTWMAAVLGIGMLGAAIYMVQASEKERRREREAFRKLDLASMTPKDIWDAALDLARKRRTELAGKNREYEDLVRHGAELIEISEGLKKCSTMMTDRSVPEEVKIPILDYWFKKWWLYMGLDLANMETLFNNLETGYVERVRQTLADYDRKRAERAEEAKRYDESMLACSFCGKSAKEVEKIIAGPSVYICNECLDLCNEIRAEDAKEEAAAKDAHEDEPE